MLRLLAIGCGLLICASLGRAQTPELFAFHSAFWMNLHTYLHALSRPGAPIDEPLPQDATPDERKTWNDAVAAYRERYGKRSLLFDAELVRITGQIAGAESGATLAGRGIPEDLRSLLESAAPAYRRHRWPSHDAANRVFVETLRPLLVRHGTAIATRLARSYGTNWPDRPVRVDVVHDAGPPGNAHTTSNPTHITIAANEPSHRGLTMLEIIFHEASHGWDEVLMNEVAAAAKRLGVRAHRSLWHAILFFNAGAITSDVLRDAGIRDYRQYMEVNQVFADLHPVVAEHWPAYLSGEISREDAIARILRAMQPAAGTLRFSKRQLFVSPYESTAVGDLNRDGHPDIVYGAYWFAGPDFVPRTFRPNHVAKEYLHSNSDHIYDVDRDGWPDVIAGGWTEDGIWWFRNPGRSAEERKAPWEMHAAWEARLLSKTRGTMEMFALHDYDGDGVPELHSANYRKDLPLEVFRWTKDAAGRPWLTPFVLGAEGGGHGFAWGDVNGDGREDVLTEIGWYERPAGDPFARAWKLHPETALPHPSCPFVVKDLNRDGRLDIIFGRGHDVGLYWWEQQSPEPDGTTVWRKHVIDESWTQAHALALADLDGDGEEELVAGKCIWAHNGGDPGAADPPAIYYYTWSRAASAFTRHTIAAPGEHIALGRQFDVVDLNGDGRLDLTAPSKLGLWVIFNRGLLPAR